MFVRIIKNPTKPLVHHSARSPSRPLSASTHFPRGCSEPANTNGKGPQPLGIPLLYVYGTMPSFSSCFLLVRSRVCQLHYQERVAARPHPGECGGVSEGNGMPPGLFVLPGKLPTSTPRRPPCALRVPAGKPQKPGQRESPKRMLLTRACWLLTPPRRGSAIVGERPDNQHRHTAATRIRPIPRPRSHRSATKFHNDHFVFRTLPR